MSSQPKLHHVVVDIFRPTDTHPGQVAEGMYSLVDNVVTLTNHAGIPVRDSNGKTYSKKVEPGEDRHRVAGRLVKQFRSIRRGKEKVVNRPLRYFPTVY